MYTLKLNLFVMHDLFIKPSVHVPLRYQYTFTNFGGRRIIIVGRTRPRPPATKGVNNKYPNIYTRTEAARLLKSITRTKANNYIVYILYPSESRPCYTGRSYRIRKCIYCSCIIGGPSDHKPVSNIIYNVYISHP